MSVTVWSLGVYLTCLAGAVDVPPSVSVNGQALSSAEWEFLRLTRGGGADLTPELRAQLVDQAIERQLIRGFLAKKKIAAPADQVAFQLGQLEDLIRRRGADPAVLLPKLGLSKELLQRELGLSVAWQAYVLQTANERTLQQYFTDHRSELDGTRVRVRQIFRRVPPEAPAAEHQAAEQLLTRLKTDIAAKKTTFEAAAKEHSQSPSGAKGGDVGWVGAPGRLPEEITVTVMKLKAGELAGPIRTTFGWHLIQVTERQAGDLSLEDAREVMLERLSAQWWRETVATERSHAKITRPD
jgi:parvulin-like peptidyl-prolyl isomerase